LAYFFKIISRTSSTKSSSLICTSVADALGRLTHILRCIMLVMFGRPGVKYSKAAAVGKPVLELARCCCCFAGASMSVFTIFALALSAMLWRRASFLAGRVVGEMDLEDAGRLDGRSSSTASSPRGLWSPLGGVGVRKTSRESRLPGLQHQEGQHMRIRIPLGTNISLTSHSVPYAPIPRPA